MKTIKQTLLHYQKGTSNKVYNVYLVQISSSEYLVNFEYGRFGSTLREGTKTSSPVAKERAEKLFDLLVVSKMKKEYVVKQGYDATKQEEKKEREFLGSDKYEDLLLQRLKRASENRFKEIDNYAVSRLIYKAGELRLEKAKEYIVELYESEVDNSNAFYYAVVWALGRFRDSTLRSTIESLRMKLDDASRYIVEEALFMLKEERETEQIKELTFSMPFKTALKNENIENFRTQVKLLDEMITSTYERYKNIDSWYEDDKKTVKNELMPLLKSADELYLKLYMYASVDAFMHEAFSNIVAYLPMTEFNFSLFRRLYKMADMRDDHEILAKLITKIESKKMACYSGYDDDWNAKPSLGCSRLYFKKRSLRYLDALALHNQNAYVSFAKEILLSMNDYASEFEAYSVEYYDDNWNVKKKKYDAYSAHLTFMKILFGAGQRYMIAPSKKVWETANKSIKDEIRPEQYPELWNKHAMLTLDILAQSTVAEVQTFAFAVLKDNPAVIEKATLSQLLPMLNLHADEPRAFFFDLLKSRYEKTNEDEIIKACLLSSDDDIALYALEIIASKNEILYAEELVADAIYSISKYIFNRLIPLLKTLERPSEIVDSIVKRVLERELEVKIELRILEVFKALHKGFEVIHLEEMMNGEKITNQHILASKLIRAEEFEHLDLPLSLKEKIANYEHPEMLATTIYLLGKLKDEELMAEHEMLVTFLYHEEKSVHKEARKIVENLAKEVDNGKVLLQAIVEKSFAAASDEVKANVVATVKKMKASYGAIEPDQLYRMLIAKSKLAMTLGGLILSTFKATDFSVVQWARMAKNENKTVRVWAYDAYMDNVELVKEAMPKSLMIFDSVWEDTRVFASGYFESFEMNTDEIIVIADSNYADVQAFAKKMIGKGDYDMEVILTKLSQHPALTIQKFVTDLMLGSMSDEQLLKMERFFNTLLHSVNQNRVAKTRTMLLLKNRLENQKVAKMVGRLASHHSATMVWADKEIYVEMMVFLAENHADIELGNDGFSLAVFGAEASDSKIKREVV